jgi:hypothetical protein
MSTGGWVLTDVWEQINRAAFIIADLTGANPNVYYELGLAHAIGKEIIPILQRGNDIPFDQRPFRILLYEDNRDGYEVLNRELPRWIARLDYASNPQLMLKNEAVGAFNDWRRTHTRFKFVGDDFAGLELPGINLSNGQLSESSFEAANLQDANLKDCLLIRANLDNANLTRADCENANISEGSLEGADLANCNLSRTLMLRTKLGGANFVGANVEGMTIDISTYNRYSSLLKNAANPHLIIVER